MTIKKIPESYLFTCDKCRKEEKQEKSYRPKYWCKLRFEQDAYDFQGNAVADGSVERLLCPECSSIVEKAINAAFSPRVGGENR